MPNIIIGQFVSPNLSHATDPGLAGTSIIRHKVHGSTIDPPAQILSQYSVVILIILLLMMKKNPKAAQKNMVRTIYTSNKNHFYKMKRNRGMADYENKCNTSSILFKCDKRTKH